MLRPAPQRRIAILDDDDDLVASIASVFERQGLSAVTFTDAQTLCAAAGTQPFDAYVVDWLLGDVTASDAITRLRGQDRTVAAPIFLLSGNLAVGGQPTDPELTQAITRFGLHYRAKPFSTLKLARDLHEAFKGEAK